ncbi:histidine kinase dimerization/phosphoacceptor domain -containing protein [Sediminibacterium ginsengisoli]|uniref:histidine kinase n=1 Tax=Sediminibacterium ginsengisoli TaxID=413434 RepID=A0A1T4LFU4_9BACT|nr:histidine kinase dimerization/phosphoacceptor domain -containing protein [Sediminibacterium ginsengisoli]SJZ53563.1 Two-component sensor histidine kinase, contains HisKA and HATPase domains [Sediminibacterium ginsengisoli]
MRQLSWLLIFLVAVTLKVAGQGVTPAQLQAQIIAEKDNGRKAQLLLQLARMNLASNREQALAGMQEALGIYRESDNKAGILNVYLSLSTYYNGTNESQTGLSFDSMALKLASELDDKRSLFQVYSNMSIHYSKMDSLNLAFKAMQRALEYKSAMPPSPVTATLYSRLGNLYMRRGDLVKAIAYTDTAINLIRKISGPQQLLGSFIMNKANFLEQQGQFDEAAVLYYEAIRIKEKLNQPRDLLSSYGNLANFYSKINNQEERYKYLQLQLAIARAENDPRFEGIALSSLGDYHALKKQQDSAFWYFNTALAVLKKAKLELPQSNVYLNISRYYYSIEKYEEALKYVEMAEAINPPAGATRLSIGFDYLFKGNILNKLGRKKEAEALLLQSLNIHKKGKSGNLQSAYKALYEFYKSSGDYEEALKYQTDFMNARDSVFNTDVERNIVKARADYEIEKRENLLAIERKDKELRSVQLSKRNQLVWLLTGLLLALFAGLVLYMRSYHLKKKTASALAEKNERIEVLIRELHHRVKNNLQVVSSLLSLQSNRLSSKAAREAMDEGRSRVDAMAMIHQRLYMNDDLAAVDMEDYLKKLSQSLASTFGFSNSIVETNVALKSPTMDIDMAVPIGLIVNELATNAFKHAFATVTDPRLSVSLNMQDEKTMNLRIADNGTGITNTELDGKEQSFGMKLVRTLVKQLGATMEVTQRNGTIFDIRISTS